MKKILFTLIAWMPITLICYFIFHIAILTVIPQNTYLEYIRNINFECFTLRDYPFIYNLKEGVCHLNNIEYKTTQHIDKYGFRNPDNSYVNSETVLIGDSHAFGFGVNDNETISGVLENKYKIKTLNLAIPTYATKRELDTLNIYGKNARNVIIVYCDNDYEENEAYIKHDNKSVEQYVREDILHAIDVYKSTKNSPTIEKVKAIYHLTLFYFNSYRSKEKSQIVNRNMQKPAEYFALTLQKYSELLKDKNILVLESSSYGYNSPNFQKNFQTEIQKINPTLKVKVLDTYQFLKSSDYYFLDDHPRPSGLSKIADLVYPQLAH